MLENESKPKRAGEYLEEAGQFFRERNAQYGDNYHDFGRIMMILYPRGFPLKTTMDWNRLGIITQILTKLTRYCNHLDRPHLDSSHDMMVYCAMLKELDNEWDAAENWEDKLRTGMKQIMDASMCEHVWALDPAKINDPAQPHYLPCPGCKLTYEQVAQIDKNIDKRHCSVSPHGLHVRLLNDQNMCCYCGQEIDQ